MLTNYNVCTYLLFLAGLGSASAYLNCPNCQAEICTRVDGSVKILGWVFCLLCGLFPGLLALCMNGFKKFTHSCPRCNMIIGTGEPPFTSGEVSYVIVNGPCFILICFFLSEMLLGCQHSPSHSCSHCIRYHRRRRGRRFRKLL